MRPWLRSELVGWRPLPRNPPAFSGEPTEDDRGISGRHTAGLPVPFAGPTMHDDAMPEALRVLLGALVASSCTIAFAAIGVCTTVSRARPGPVPAELDHVLEVILAPSGADDPEPARSRRGWCR
jgi:hypothetical protein